MNKNNRLKSDVKNLMDISIIAALYVVLTILIEPISFGPTQFRVSELLMLMVFFNKKHVFSLTLGCFIANLWSPYLLWDMLFGTTATLLACIFISKSKHLFVASLWPVIFNGLIVGAEIAIIDQLPYGMMVLSVALGELVVVTIIGCLIFNLISKNEQLKEIISQ